ncbi:WG repeat-containing protein [Leptospira stimsonii]
MPPKYNRVDDFSEGLALVKYGRKWGYIDKYGKEYWED